MRPKIYLVFIIIALCLLPMHTSHSALAFKKKIRSGIPPFTILEKIMQANKNSSSIAAVDNAPLITWLAPSDPRIKESHILASSTESLFAIRNLGSVLSTAIDSVDFGILRLRTPVLLITESTDSQAFALAQDIDSDPDLQISNELLPLVAFIRNPDFGEENLPRHLVEHWIDSQVSQAVERYRSRIDNHRLVVIGAVIDFANHYNRGEGRLIIINVNGETDSARLKHLSLMRRLDKDFLDYVGRQGTAIYQSRSKMPPQEDLELIPPEKWQNNLIKRENHYDLQP